MDLYEHLKSLTGYNVWANTKVQHFIFQTGEDKAVTVQKSSFDTIKSTLIHIWDAQSIWIDRIEGREITQWPGKDFAGTATEAAEGLVQNSVKWNQLINDLKPSDINNPVHYKNLAGIDFDNTLAEIAAHVMNHGTYHRGQLVTMLRGAGFTALESTDFITYTREIR